MSAAGPLSGSARVSRAGDGVAPSRTFTKAQPGNGAHYYRRRLPHFERPWAIYAMTISTEKGRCLSPRARTIVLNSLRHFHNQRYELFAACVMPDHAHLLLQPWPDDNGNGLFWPLSELMHSIKSFSAHRINEVENKAGAVWEKERFDRYIRSGRDLEEKFHYIWRNPLDSGVAKQNEHEETRKESSFRRDAETGTRDACATQRRET
jgi:putative transposase